MRNVRTWLTSFGLLALAAGCMALAGGGLLGDGVAAAGKRAFDRSDLDSSCKPCQDFFQYANGGWIKSNPIQPAYSSWGRFSALQDKNQTVLRRILEDAARNKNAAPGSVEQKIGDFYGSCMDAERIENAGIKPIEPELARIAQNRESSAAPG
jgi:putative endopeptidase